MDIIIDLLDINTLILINSISSFTVEQEKIILYIKKWFEQDKFLFKNGPSLSNHISFWDTTKLNNISCLFTPLKI